MPIAGIPTPLYNLTIGICTAAADVSEFSDECEWGAVIDAVTWMLGADIVSCLDCADELDAVVPVLIPTRVSRSLLNILVSDDSDVAESAFCVAETPCSSFAASFLRRRAFGESRRLKFKSRRRRAPAKMRLFLMLEELRSLPRRCRKTGLIARSCSYRFNAEFV